MNFYNEIAGNVEGNAAHEQQKLQEVNMRQQSKPAAARSDAEVNARIAAELAALTESTDESVKTGQIRCLHGIGGVPA